MPHTPTSTLPNVELWSNVPFARLPKYASLLEHVLSDTSEENQIRHHVNLDESSHRYEELKYHPVPSLEHSEMIQLAPLLRDLTTFLSKVHSAKNKENKLEYQEYGFRNINAFLIWVRKVSPPDYSILILLPENANTKLRSFVADSTKRRHCYRCQ